MAKIVKMKKLLLKVWYREKTKGVAIYITFGQNLTRIKKSEHLGFLNYPKEINCVPHRSSQANQVTSKKYITPHTFQQEP